MALEVQSIYAKVGPWSASSLQAWMARNGYMPTKEGRIYGDEIRFRIRDPGAYDGFVTKKLTNGVHLVLGRRKK